MAIQEKAASAGSVTGARQRLLELATQRRASLAALSHLIGRNSAYLQQFVRKGSPRKLEENDRHILAQFFGVSDAELSDAEDKSYAMSPIRSGGDWVEVPRLPLDASAGPGAFGAQETPYDTFRFSKRWLREQGLESAMLSAITVSGDSMEPLLHDGDEILVDRAPRPLRDGVHVLRLGEVLHVKRMQPLGQGRIQLISANSAYPPVDVALADVDVIGRVVWKGGRV